MSALKNQRRWTFGGVYPSAGFAPGARGWLFSGGDPAALGRPAAQVIGRRDAGAAVFALIAWGTWPRFAKWHSP